MRELNGQGQSSAISRGGDSLADILDRVLDKGVVIAGDIRINLLDIELLTIKVRLLIASADKAREMGIDWWSHDPHLTHQARMQEDEVLSLKRENRQLRERLDQLESSMSHLLDRPGEDERGSLPVSQSARAKR